MQFALLIYGDETIEMPAEGTKEMMDGYRQFGERNHASILGGDALRPTSTATTVRVQDGRTLTTDGPFAEIKEAIGGYCVVEADDLDAAIEVAAKIPSASMGGGIEVRPVKEW